MTPEALAELRGAVRPWWDVVEKRKVNSATLYLAQGCPDWGEDKYGNRNDKCAFCPLPYAAMNYRNKFFGGKMTQEDHVNIFLENLKIASPPSANMHTVMVFNAGSFLARNANSAESQRRMTEAVAAHPTIKRFVIESRAPLVTEKAIKSLMDILQPVGKKLTIRIGVETQDDHLRLNVLKKGHSRKELMKAKSVMKKYGVESGGYVLLNPAPEPDFDRSKAIEETLATFDWILGDEENQLGMNEAYYCSTNVGPGTLLEEAWKNGKFRPASLWMVYQVLEEALKKYGGRVHLLPFKDEPELLSVPSNHVWRGIPQNLSGAQGCDLAFHKMFEEYRNTLDPKVLVPPICNCKDNA